MCSDNDKNILPNGKYTVVSIDVDTTGRRLIDEIVHLAAYTPDKQYSQYIMPYMNLNPAARQRHQVRVITVGFYRMLKCMQTFKVVKSKSEVAALKEFLDWIENVKKSDESSLGVILLYHEERKFVPYVILEAFKKYNLLERLFETVKSFANGYQLAKDKCPNNIKYYSLRQLSRSFLSNDQRDKDQFEGNARVRAKLAYQVISRLAKDETMQSLQQQQDIEQLPTYDKMLRLIMNYTNPIIKDINELDMQNKIVERQNSFRPVFLQYFKTTLYHRVKAVKFRIILAERGHDYETLKTIWNEKRKEGLTEVIQGIDELKSEEKNELIQILDCHFDPVKQSVKPVIRRSRRRRIRNRSKENVTPRGGGGVKERGGGNGINIKGSVGNGDGDCNGNYGNGDKLNIMKTNNNNNIDGKYRSSNRKMIVSRRLRSRNFSKNPLSSNF